MEKSVTVPRVLILTPGLPPPADLTANSPDRARSGRHYSDSPIELNPHPR